MPERRLKGRKRIRQKEVLALLRRMEASYGSSPFSEGDQVDRAGGRDFDVLYVSGQVVALVVDDEPFPTVRGLLRSPGGKRHVTVDMGAVPYVYNGADVMSPGIVDADPEIAVGDMVWVRDERNLRPLAVGKALLAGGEMASSRHGRAVETVHHVGDWLWMLGEG
ncbi:MAG: RNA-binding protein [Thermoplasmata archaeon]